MVIPLFGQFLLRWFIFVFGHEKMQKKPFPWSFILSVIVGCLFIYIVIVSNEHRCNGIVNEGKDAYRSGISDAANPYKESWDRVLWLQGWSEAKNKK